MTLEQALARIEELEAENAGLRRSKKKARAATPDSLLIEYPWLHKKGGSLIEKKLSELVRAACFPIIKKQRNVRNGRDKYMAMCDYITRLDDMSDAEYRRYTQIFGELLEVIERWRTEEGSAP